VRRPRPASWQQNPPYTRTEDSTVPYSSPKSGHPHYSASPLRDHDDNIRAPCGSNQHYRNISKFCLPSKVLQSLQSLQSFSYNTRKFKILFTLFIFDVEITLCKMSYKLSGLCVVCGLSFAKVLKVIYCPVCWWRLCYNGGSMLHVRWSGVTIHPHPGQRRPRKRRQREGGATKTTTGGHPRCALINFHYYIIYWPHQTNRSTRSGEEGQYPLVVSLPCTTERQQSQALLESKTTEFSATLIKC
jgi:hypothetical protein